MYVGQRFALVSQITINKSEQNLISKKKVNHDNSIWNQVHDDT